MAKSRRKSIPLSLFEPSAIEPLAPFYSAVNLQRESVPSFDDYPFNIPAIRAMESVPLHPKATFFIGENGSGKSTLLEALAVKLKINPEGGSKNFHFETRASHSDLCDYLDLETPPRPRRATDCFFLRAESFFNVATEIEKLDDDQGRPSEIPKLIEYFGGRSLHEQSHGESFFALINERFRGDGFYLLDEPEAALSPSRQMTMLAILHRHISDGSQFVIATHSPILMAYPEAFIYSFGKEGIKRIEYEETDHYRLTRNFLNRREYMLQILLSDEP